MSDPADSDPPRTVQPGARELRNRASEANEIAYHLERHGELLAGLYVSPADAVAAIAHLIRLRARRYDEIATDRPLEGHRPPAGGPPMSRAKKRPSPDVRTGWVPTNYLTTTSELKPSPDQEPAMGDPNG